MGDRLATIYMGRKLGAVPHVAGAEAYHHAKFDFDPSNRLATIHPRHADRQRDNTDNGPIA